MNVASCHNGASSANSLHVRSEEFRHAPDFVRRSLLQRCGSRRVHKERDLLRASGIPETRQKLLNDVLRFVLTLELQSEQSSFEHVGNWHLDPVLPLIAVRHPGTADESTLRSLGQTVNRATDRIRVTRVVSFSHEGVFTIICRDLEACSRVASR